MGVITYPCRIIDKLLKKVTNNHTADVEQPVDWGNCRDTEVAFVKQTSGHMTQ